METNEPWKRDKILTGCHGTKGGWSFREWMAYLMLDLRGVHRTTQQWWDKGQPAVNIQAAQIYRRGLSWRLRDCRCVATQLACCVTQGLRHLFLDRLLYKYTLQWATAPAVTQPKCLLQIHFTQSHQTRDKLLVYLLSVCKLHCGFGHLETFYYSHFKAQGQ